MNDVVKHLIVMAAGLGWRSLERRRRTDFCGLEFRPAESVFPAVTCVAQASLRTGRNPCEHGMTSNGHFSRSLMKPAFWEQSSKLVHGKRIWDDAHRRGERVGLYFFQQSLGEQVDQIISPAPIHKHGGGMIMRNYTKPAEMGEILNRKCGTFPLMRYWGPLASAKVGDAVIDNFIKFGEVSSNGIADYAFLYMPSLDYEAQRYGPFHPASDKALTQFEGQLRRLAMFAEKQGAEFTVMGDYEITEVTLPPAFPNRTLRAAGFFRTRPVGSRQYPDFYESRAFAMCDHEVAHVYVQRADDVENVRRIFEASGDYRSVEIRGNQSWAHESAGEILLVAKEGSWCAYPWWTDSIEAPDWATHIDIHSKPGYDPCELFFDRWFGFIPVPATCQDPLRIKGTHGRPCKIAHASTDKRIGGDSLLKLANMIFPSV